MTDLHHQLRPCPGDFLWPSPQPATWSVTQINASIHRNFLANRDVDMKCATYTNIYLHNYINYTVCKNECIHIYISIYIYLLCIYAYKYLRATAWSFTVGSSRFLPFLDLTPRNLPRVERHQRWPVVESIDPQRMDGLNAFQHPKCPATMPASTSLAMCRCGSNETWEISNRNCDFPVGGK